MSLIDPAKFGQYMERLDNVCAALERNTIVQEATIQANNQRHTENEKRIEALENERSTFKNLFQGGFMTLKGIGLVAIIVLIFAANGVMAGINWLLGVLGG